MTDEPTYSMGYYIRDLNGEPVPYPDGDVLGWAQANTTANEVLGRHVKKEWIGPYFISTVFLGLDHNFSNRLTTGASEPLVFETMVFTTHKEDGEVKITGLHGEILFQRPYSAGDIHYTELDCDRCGTLAGAISQHDRIADKVRLLYDATQGIDVDVHHP